MSATARAARRYQPSLMRHRMFTFGGAIGLFAAIFILAPGWLAGATRLVTAYDAALILIITMSWLGGARIPPIPNAGPRSRIPGATSSCSS